MSLVRLCYIDLHCDLQIIYFYFVLLGTHRRLNSSQIFLSLSSVVNLEIEAPSTSSSSRYDPRGISVIHDINDLVHDDDNNSDDSDNYDNEICAPPRHHNSLSVGQKGVRVGEGSRGKSLQHNSSSSNRRSNDGNTKPSIKDQISSSTSWISSIMKNRQIHCPTPGGRWWIVDLSTLDISLRQIILLLSLVGIIVVASIGIGYAVVGPNVNDSDAAAPLNDEGVVVVEVAAGKQQQGVEVGEAVDEESTAKEDNEQDLFQIAEQVVTACAESMLDVDMSGCQTLCHASMCCFEESERYSCVDDEWKHCVVYAACANLLDGEEGGRRRRKEEEKMMTKVSVGGRNA